MLTVGETARALGLKESTIRAWISQRRIAFVRLGRAIRIDAATVAAVIADNTVPTRGQARHVQRGKQDQTSAGFSAGHVLKRESD
jgi:excisionase family DNA binding protein